MYANIKQGLICLEVINSLAFQIAELITDVKCFIGQTPGIQMKRRISGSSVVSLIKLFGIVIYT